MKKRNEYRVAAEVRLQLKLVELTVLRQMTHFYDRTTRLTSLRPILGHMGRDDKGICSLQYSPCTNELRRQVA